MSASLQQENENLKWRLRQLEGQMVKMGREISGEEAAAMRDAEAKFDAIAAALGESAGPPLWGETETEYRQRLLQKLAQFSERFKNSDMRNVTGPALDVVEECVYNDAANAARNSALPGKMIEIKQRDSSGRMITKHYGDPMAWMGHFMIDGQCGRLNTDPNRR